MWNYKMLLDRLSQEALDSPPFTPAIATNRPLATALDEFGQAHLASIRNTTNLAELDAFAATSHERLASTRPVPPALGAGGAGRFDEDWLWGDYDENGVRRGLTRFWFRRELTGSFGFLSRWPTASNLAAIDPDTKHAYLATGQPVWRIQLQNDDPRDLRFALYTTIDLSEDDLALVEAGDLDLQEVYDSRERQIQPILDRIHAEVQDYFNRVLPERIEAAIAERRKRLGQFAGIQRSVSFREEWKLESPRITAAPAPLAGERSSVDQSLKTPLFRDRLAEASFSDLQKAIRVWANAIERYPRAFGALDEERISDLLAATLHASLPGADREVFSKHGKTDIFVRAKALDDGSSDARVFIAETKFAKSKRVVQEALDPQLFGYLNSADTSAVLLLLFRQKGLLRAREGHLQNLREVSGYTNEEKSSVEGWPIFRYELEDKSLQLLVASVHIPS